MLNISSFCGVHLINFQTWILRQLSSYLYWHWGSFLCDTYLKIGWESNACLELATISKFITSCFPCMYEKNSIVFHNFLLSWVFYVHKTLFFFTSIMCVFEYLMLKKTKKIQLYQIMQGSERLSVNVENFSLLVLVFIA